MKIKQKYPSISYLEEGAKNRIPKFAWDYLEGGGVRETCIARNRMSFDQWSLTPKHLAELKSNPSITKKLFNHNFDAPFGVAPIGLNGLIWPKSSEYLSLAARRQNLPFVLSMYATASLEDIAAIGAPANTWFQHYPQNHQSINHAIIMRAKDAGYETLVITVDVPTTRKVRDIRNGLTLPIRPSVKMFYEVLKRPKWAFATLRNGTPNFPNWFPHMPEHYRRDQMAKFLEELPIRPHQTTIEELVWYRDIWSGKVIVKGVLHEDEALKCKKLGIDGIILSNHGGRQLDEAPSALEMLAQVRRSVGLQYPLLVDGGFRSGGDIATAIALGADFVLLGRPFMFGMAALGRLGAEHVMELLREELLNAMYQLGCTTVSRLPDFLSVVSPPSD